MTITQLTNSVCSTGADMQPIIRNASTELASVQAGMGIHSLFRPSYTDCETGLNGCRFLIARILKENGAVVTGQPVNVLDGMTTEDIIKAARVIYGYDKYPDRTYEQNLSVVMSKSNQVLGIRRTGTEDADRNSESNQAWRASRGKDAICKPSRKSWFLVE